MITVNVERLDLASEDDGPVRALAWITLESMDRSLKIACGPWRVIGKRERIYGPDIRLHGAWTSTIRVDSDTMSKIGSAILSQYAAAKFPKARGVRA